MDRKGVGVRRIQRASDQWFRPRGLRSRGAGVSASRSDVGRFSRKERQVLSSTHGRGRAGSIEIDLMALVRNTAMKLEVRHRCTEQ